MFDRERDLPALGRIEAELASVDAAMSRIDADTYGTCNRCGDPIEDEVLAGDPMAARCRLHAS